LNEQALSEKPKDFLIVGLGASAGGVQALREFFEHTPPQSGMAYVVILHLSPDHDSQLAAVLQQVTTMPVAQVTERVRVRPNHVYVVPPDQHLLMEDEHIAVVRNTHVADRRAPVDIFFRTLADSHQARAVGVILSGTGANGSMGIKRIKERGGAAFVQNPREAEYNEMPRNAIATELIDESLPVREIPAKIVAYKESLATVDIPQQPEHTPEDQQQALREIFTMLRVRTGHDFSNYKRPTLLRRIERRINVRNLPNLPMYAAYMHDHPEESVALLKDLLISVTNFYRDRHAFEHIQTQILPAILAKKHAGDSLRMWCIGCATGEEAYSLAMLCAEQTAGVIDAPKIQIFASDIDEEAIATAREGYYTLNDAADVSPERLRRFFNHDGDGYRIRREIREMILFANQNVLKDPPFSHIDLVSCRNMLIYLNSTAQERVMETVHFALEPGGYLFLGSAESAATATDLFNLVSQEHHIYQARVVGVKQFPVPEAVPHFRFDKSFGMLATEAESRQAALTRISYGELHQQLLEAYAPPSIVVNEEYEIVHLTERAGRYLQMGGGEPSQNLLRLIRPELRLEVRTALYQAVQRQVAVEARGLKVRIEDRTETVNVLIRPVMETGEATKGFILLLFEPAIVEAGDGAQAIVEAADTGMAQHLEDELIRVKSQLRSSVEQFELQNEELKASNEELQAMNEEMRSAAEELETSKEELQSINEELTTVNQELKVKVEELSMSSSNLQNLINSTDIATVFLDRSFRVALFTPPARDIYNLIPADIGRPLSDITSKLAHDAFLEDAEAVLEKLTTLEREIDATDGKTYLMRVSPYRTEEDRINGVVLTFLNITGRKRAEAAIRDSDAQKSFLLRLDDALLPLHDGAAIEDAATRFVVQHFRAERCYYAVLDGHQATVRDTGRAGLPSVAGVYDMDAFPMFKKLVESGSPIVVDDVHTSDKLDESLRSQCLQLGVVSFIAVPVLKEGRAEGILCITQSAPRVWTRAEIDLATEITGRTWVAVSRAQAEEALRESEGRNRALVENMPGSAVFIVDKELRYTLAQGGALRTTEYSPKDFIGKTVEEVLDEGGSERVEHYRKALAGESFHLEHTERDRSFSTHGTPLRNAAGEVYAVLVISYDVTDLKHVQEALRQSEEHMRLIMESVRDYAIITTDLKRHVTSWNTGAEKIFGYTADEMMGQSADIIFLPEDRERGEPKKEADTALDKGRAADERWHLRKDGSRFYASGVMNVLHDGYIHGFVKVARDLTEQKETQEALREAEERQRIVLEAAELCTWDWDVTGGHVVWNEQCFKMLGLEEGSAVPQTQEEFDSFLHPDDRERAQADVKAALNGSAPYRSEFRIIRADDEQVRWMASYGRAMSRDDAGNATRVTGVMYDITQRKEVEQRKDEFLGVASHELKTPLTAMKAYAEVLEDMMNDTPNPAEAGEVVRKLDDSIDRLDGLIRELLDATRINEGRLELKKEPLDLAALVHECVEEAQRTTRTHRFEVEGGDLPPILADRHRIRQVLSNVLSNAVKYSPASDRIVVQLSKKEGSVEVCVQDFGVGISEAATDKVFDRFFREPDPALKTFPGLGLGLYIANEIVQLHGGKLTVESRKGEGSTFCFTLPTGA